MTPATMCLALLVGVAPAAEPQPSATRPAPSKPHDPVPWWVPSPYRDTEFTRMFFAILSEPIMSIGPGKGWFGPSQSRYSWEWVAKQHGVLPTAELSEEKFAGSPELFAVLDRDKNGVLRADDFDWSDDAPFVRQTEQARRWLDRADKNSDRKLTRDEWDALFNRAASGKDYLTVDDVRRLLFPAAPARPSSPPPGMMPSTATLLIGLLSGEIGSSRPGPAVGDLAPDFTLKTPDGKETIQLANFRGKKPVVLVFGSFT
jgi:hypothetical protein